MSEVLMGERTPTILNRGISISDLQEVAQKTHSVISITARPEGLFINIIEATDAD